MINRILSMAGPLARLSTALMMGVSGSSFAADLPDVAPAQFADTPEMYDASGVIGLYGAYTISNGDTGDEDSDGWMLGGDARGNVWLTPSISVQLDIRGEAGKVSPDTDPDEGRGNVTAGGHLTWRNPDMFALGVFGGIAGGSVLNEEGFETRSILGVEGQYYWNDFTLYGQVGYSGLIQKSDDDHAEMEDAWFARAVGRWFFTPNDKIEGEVGFMRADDNVGGNNDDIDTWNWGALYEHQYAGSAFSSYVEYDGLDRKDNSHSNPGVTEHIFMVGVRINLNQPDLKTADRYGATLDLPDVIRTENWAERAH